MAKVVSFNMDAPGLKPSGVQVTTRARRTRVKHGLFDLQITSDYLSFAGQQEFRAYVLTASNESNSNESKRYTRELPDRMALLGWFIDVLKMEPNEASDLTERAEHGKPISMECPLDQAGLEKAGFVPSEEVLTPKAVA